MTGTAGHIGRWLRRRTSGVPSGVAVLAAGSMLAGLALSACGPDVASAATVLRSPRAATVELSGGGTRPATDGMTVPKGATVRTAAGGSASLVAAKRTVLLGSATAVTVVDGAREQLRQGLVFIDARRSPGVLLGAGAATVKAPRGALARVERGVLLRAASFRETLTVQATGRRKAIPVSALHQVQVPDGGRPGRVTPLALTRDRWERRYALDLVTSDTDLAALADGLDSDATSSAAVMSVLPASFVGSTTPGASRSDTALAFVVAKASGANPDDVRAWRADGGSWGVVAAIAGASVAKISAALDAILNSGGTPVVAIGPVGPVSPNGGGGTGGNTGVQPSPATGGRPSTRPSPRPSPSPSSDPVQDVVTTVTHLLPTPTPTPITVPIGPSPSPIIKIGVGGVGITVG